MNPYDPRTLSTPALLGCFADILEEVKQRRFVRTHNNPVVDYAEWLVAQELEACLQENLEGAYDATNTKAMRIQIKKPGVPK